MGHEVVDGADGRVFDEVLVDKAIAVSNPLLAAVAGAFGAVVLLLAPNGVGVAEPEGRCPGANGGVEIYVGLYFADALLDVDDGFGVFKSGGAAVGPCSSLDWLGQEGERPFGQPFYSPHIF